ncbi:mitochondrial tRNA-lysidine synthetase [Xylogone sp. PMI_703]|nr:mitochondrial tRNA-lysidine synthetase [Xylogone sp. PMI_703]
MGVIRNAARPVTISEFKNSLLKIWRPRSFSGQDPVTLGLAISGGVDSMALAVLCSRLITSQRDINACIPNISLQAFVVDHRAREGSNLEAKNVADILQNNGIRTQILTLDWHGSSQPSKLPNFETLARRYRFQALGLACKELNIKSLLLAHHEDDQAETVLMRLIAGHRGLGLAGIKSSAGIPECYGIHGVYESGALDDQLGDFKPPNGNNSLEYNVGLEVPNLNSENGGIRIYRPLLGFSKDRLIATAQVENMPWFEDLTNKDPTLTRRNAVRYLFKSYQLPAALSKSSLLSMSRRIDSRHEALQETAKQWLIHCQMMDFEWRTGTLRVRFPKDLELLGLSSDSNLPRSPKEIPEIALLMVREVVKIVTPDEHVPLSSLHSTVERIFLELFPDGREIPNLASFATSGVQFQLMSSATEEQQDREWLISRQQYISSPCKRPMHEVLPSDTWSPWILYDGRYWIRILNQHSVPLRVRPFRKEDLQGFKSSLSRTDRKSLENILKSLAPGDIRWTLPAIVALYDDGTEKLLCLPTLGFRIPDSGLKWQIRYKKIDIDNLVPK